MKDDIENNYLGDARHLQPEEALVLMANALLDSIPRDKTRLNAFRVLNYLARRTIELVRTGNEPEIPTKDIHVDLNGNANQEPSAWLSPLWTAIEGRIYEQIKPAVIERCRALGLSQYPRPARRSGSPAMYRLEAVALGAAEPSLVTDTPVHRDIDRRVAVAYEQDMTLRLSWLGQLVFDGSLAWTRSKRVTLIVVIAITCLFLGVVAYIGYAVLVTTRTPLSAADVITGLILIGGPWAAYRWFEKQMRIFDDRIAIAPEWALSWKEFGATMELVGEMESGGTQSVKVVRYTARCPICDGTIKLDAGEPDYPRRLVGRCSRSPREHVYSFDRVTRRGAVLISPG